MDANVVLPYPACLQQKAISDEALCQSYADSIEQMKLMLGERVSQTLEKASINKPMLWGLLGLFGYCIFHKRTCIVLHASVLFLCVPLKRAASETSAMCVSTPQPIEASTHAHAHIRIRIRC